MQAISTTLQIHSRYREQLLTAYDDIDDETLNDTLEGLTDLNEMIAETLRKALDDEASCLALKTRIEAMRARASRLADRAKSLRRLTGEIMTEAQLDRIISDDMTVTVRPGSLALGVTDEGAIPEQYFRAQPAKLDRRAVLIALKAGLEIAGANLADASPVLTVRTK